MDFNLFIETIKLCKIFETMVSKDMDEIFLHFAFSTFTYCYFQMTE
jgi:hypothetical protein